jgi:predicted metal-dependent phosphoesterase TrpH
MIIDMHVHTNRAGPHSNLDPLTLIREGKRIGLDGVLITEHDQTWPREYAQELAAAHDFVILRGMEVSTDLGHIVVIGLNQYIGGIHRAKNLQQIARAEGAFTIGVHPYRRLVDPGYRDRMGRLIQPLTLDQGTELPLLYYVDEIETMNGGTSERENDFAWQIAQRLGFRGTGGSDAHSIHGIGCCATVFEDTILTEQDLIEALRAKRFYPCASLLQGDRSPYTGPRYSFDTTLVSSGARG